MGTDAIHGNPALLGVKTGQIIERTLNDTFKVSYKVKLAQSDDKGYLQEIILQLEKDKFEKEYIIVKEDSLFSLFAREFKNSFTAFNFSSSLPVSIPLRTIYADTTWQTVEIPKTYYSIEIFTSPDKNSLKLFKDQMSESLKEFSKEVVFEDSLFKFYIGPFKSEEKAVMLKNGPKIQTINDGSSVVSYNNKVPSGLSPKFSLTFPLRFTVSMQNNTLNTTWFNKYLRVNMIENPSLKSDLIKSIPPSGISGFLVGSVGALDMTYSNYGISLFNTNAYYSVDIPKEMMQVLFDGVRFNQSQNISNFDTKGFIVNESTFSMGSLYNIKQLPFTTYLGLGIRFLNGLFSYTDSYNGVISTKEDSIFIFSDLNMIYTNNDQMATGFGFDIGAYGQVNKKVSAQISFMGIGSYLKSKSASIRKNISEINLSNDQITEMLEYNSTQIDSINETFSILDTVESIKGIRIALPARINIAANYRYNDNIHLKTALKFITQTSFIESIDPEVCFGLKIFPNKAYSVLSGLSIGGLNKINIGGGLDIKVKRFSFDLAGGQSGGLFNSAQGFTVSFGTTYSF